MENDYYKRYEPFFGEWHIKRFLGAGSYGRVFEIERRDAFDTVYTGALKAITIPSSPSELEEILADGMDMNGASTYFRDYVKELNREIALMSKLKGHSNIVSYEDHKMFQHEDGVGWDILIRMELLTPITSLLRENRTFPRRKVIQLGIDLCRALEICQRYNIIHRDIKPANIFLSDTEDFKLGDFGVARIASAATGASTRAGTVNYMAPEVFRGEKYSSNVDLYSLGLVMYQLLNNNRMPLYPPYPQAITPSSRERAQARRLAGAALPAPVNAGGRLAEIVLKACAPDPAQRYDSPTVMRQALEAIRYDEREAADIYPEGDSLPVPGTDGSSLTGTAPSAPAAEATERLLDAAPAAEPQTAAESLPGQTAAQGDRTTFLFESQAEKRRQVQEAEEVARRKAAEEKEAELARIRAEKRAAQQAEETARRAQEEAARKAQEEAARKAQSAVPPLPPKQPAPPRKKNRVLLLIPALVVIVLAANVAVNLFTDTTLKTGGTADSAADALYKAGTYTATAENDIGSVVVEMTFSADAITDVNIDASSQTKGIGQEAAQPMQEAILAAQSADVDGCSGATLTSDAIKQAAADCIAQASTGKAASSAASEKVSHSAASEKSTSASVVESAAASSENENAVSSSSSVSSPSSSVSSSSAASSSKAVSSSSASVSSSKAVAVSPTAIASGKCGKNAKWALEPDGTLRITGTGAMWDYNWNKNVNLWHGTNPGGPDDYEDQIKTVIIEDGITSIGDHAFSNCRNMTSVSIPNSVTSISDYAFYDCQLLASLSLPDSITKIPNELCADCHKLTTVKLPSRVTSIGESAFSCTALQSINIPESVTSIGAWAFSATNLTSVVIPASITRIEYGTFYCSRSLSNVTIPASVKFIDEGAFQETKLTSVTISRDCSIVTDSPHNNNSFPSTVQINYYD